MLLLQVPTPTPFDWERVLFTQGPLYVVFALIVWMVIWYGPKLLEAHRDMLTTTKESTFRTAMATEQTASCIKSLTDSLAVAASASMEEHRRTHRALDHVAEAGKESTDCEATKRHLENAQQELRHGIRLPSPGNV